MKLAKLEPGRQIVFNKAHAVRDNNVAVCARAQYGHAARGTESALRRDAMKTRAWPRLRFFCSWPLCIALYKIARFALMNAFSLRDNTLGKYCMQDWKDKMSLMQHRLKLRQSHPAP